MVMFTTMFCLPVTSTIFRNVTESAISLQQNNKNKDLWLHVL